ncbi:ABC-type transporter, periplasmic subunit [Gemmatirosa kalamazoonensis]|uniref:ABC-type transporter, periplasmic subunit n=2 Tax=Gemmatirosa kalamazoonensis TaxID=861299 RepID=W0RKW1_9BACT|nr:ABC-type transporter, periplasmic subunit [Gemmatirosa kalamazoonensis]
MRRLLVLTGLSLATLAGCRGGTADAANRRSIVDSRDTYDPRSLDPSLSTDVPTGRAVSYVFDGLTRFTPDARVVPGLATRWEVSPDGRTYTFHLRPGVKFHDGTPLTARAVVATFRRVLAPGSTAGRTWPLQPIEGAAAFLGGKSKALEGVAAVDDSTVKVTLHEPLSIFPKFLAMPVASIVPENAGADFGQHPIGTGPWKFVEWKHDDYLKFAKNASYFGGAPGIDTLIARIIPEPSTAQAEFESGNVDILAVAEGETRNWEQTDDKAARLQSAPALRLYYLAINTTRGPLADARVRQAINLAIDRKTILDRLIAGRGRLAAGVIPPALDSGGPQRDPYPYDTVKAKQLLAAAGHANGIDVELWSSQDATFARLAQTIQGYLAKVGIRAKIVQRDASSVREAARNGQVDLYMKDWWADYPDPDAFLYPLLHSASKGVGGNVSFYGNATFDSLVTTARHTQDETFRMRLARQADSVAFADAPMAYLFFYNELYAIQPWIRGFQVPQIFNGQPLNAVRIETAGTR